MDILRHYIDKFEALDGGRYPDFFVKDGCIYDFLKENLPVFTCDDQDVEEIYYFRAYTFSKHIKRASDGRLIVTEFLPVVPWSMNTEGAIACPVGHQLRELRWFKHGDAIGRDYISYWCDHIDDLLTYTNWFVYAVWEYCDMTDNMDFAYSLVDKLIEYFTRFCDAHKAACGLYKSVDNYDGMEYSVSSHGIRPTVNSYVYANAFGLSEILAYRHDDRAQEYRAFADRLKVEIAEKLYRDDFYYALPLEEGEEMPRYKADFCNPQPKYFVKEQIGYVPFYFDIPPAEHYAMWKFVVDPKTFLAPCGLTTADISDEQYCRPFPHMCLWNGPVWPFATSQTLTGLSNALKSNVPMPVGKKEYTFLLRQYARSHRITDPSGVTRPWIDEDLDGQTGEWLARAWLYERNAYDKDRGVDYNHSTYIDLALNGLCGLDVKNGVPRIQPQAEGIAFDLVGVRLRDEIYDLHFDGKNLTVTAKTPPKKV